MIIDWPLPPIMRFTIQGLRFTIISKTEIEMEFKEDLTFSLKLTRYITVLCLS